LADDVDRALAEHGADLADAVERALPVWAARVVVERGGPALRDAGEAAGRAAADALVPELRALLAADVDRQRANPMTLLRRAVAWPAAVLAEAGVPAPRRDDHARAHFPDDDYGLTPMTFGDIDPSLHEAGILWGALKARAHLVRHGR
jgi:hypothetical protein